MRKNKKLHIPPEPLLLKLQMQKMFLSQATHAEGRKEWRIAVKRTEAEIKKYGFFRKVKNEKS